MIFAQKDSFLEKYQSLAQAMVKNPEWGGSMGCVGLFAFPVGSESYLDGALDGHMLLGGDDGSKAWTRIYKNNQKNYSHIFFTRAMRYLLLVP